MPCCTPEAFCRVLMRFNDGIGSNTPCGNWSPSSCSSWRSRLWHFRYSSSPDRVPKEHRLFSVVFIHRQENYLESKQQISQLDRKIHFPKDVLILFVILMFFGYVHATWSTNKNHLIIHIHTVDPICRLIRFTIMDHVTFNFSTWWNHKYVTADIAGTRC